MHLSRSILGPFLWNLGYDDLVRRQTGGDIQYVAYADDLAVMVSARSRAALDVRIRATLRKVKTWFKTNHLEVAHQKTEFIQLTGRHRGLVPGIIFGGHTITATTCVKYLGVRIDAARAFGKDVEFACNKAQRVILAIARLMPEKGGTSMERRRLLLSVATSIALYGCPVWADMAKRHYNFTRLVSLQRQGMLRITRTYRTVSTDALCVIAGVPPIDLVIKKRTADYYNKKRPQRLDVTVNEPDHKWQGRWERSPKGRWTYKLIPHMSTWLARPRGQVSFHLTQFLSGHGCYPSYLHKIGMELSPTCWNCGAYDNAEHAFFRCSSAENLRRDLEMRLGAPFDIGSVLSLLTRSRDSWDAIVAFVTAMLKERERIERIREASGRK